MFKLTLVSTLLLLRGGALPAQTTDHDAPVRGGNGSFWLSLRADITQSPAPAASANILQHTHHDKPGLHRVRIFDSATLSPANPPAFEMGDKMLVFFGNDANPSVVIHAERGSTANFPAHAGQLEALCPEATRARPGAAGPWKGPCTPDRGKLGRDEALRDVAELAPGEVNPGKIAAAAERLTHVWRFEARNGGSFAQVPSIGGRVAYYYKDAAGSTNVTPTRFAILKAIPKANQPNPQTIAHGLNNRPCWMFEISAPRKVSDGILEDSIALGDLPKAQQACKAPRCVCPNAMFKPGLTVSSDPRSTGVGVSLPRN